MKTLIKILEMSLLLVYTAYGQKRCGRDRDNASKYEGSQLIKVRKTPFVSDLVDKRGLDLWNGNSTFYDILVKKKELRQVKRLLYRNDILYTVVDENIANTIRENNIECLRSQHRRRNNSYIPSFYSYQRVEEIYDYLDYLARTYPEIACVGIMGYTAQKKPLKYIKISSGSKKAKTFFIDGGIHAREWIAPAAVTFIIKQLVERQQNLPTEFLYLDFIVVPVLNPDGYEYTYKTDRLWRKNRSRHGKCRGVDINRNFDIAFGGKGTSGDPCMDTYRGPGPNSELETQAITKFLLHIKDSLVGYVTFHSYGQYILIPYCYDKYVLPEDFDDLKRVGDEAAAAIEEVDSMLFKVGNTVDLLYAAAGGSIDWVKKNTAAKYSYAIELRDQGKHCFLLPEKFIFPASVEAFEAIVVIASAAYRDRL